MDAMKYFFGQNTVGEIEFTYFSIAHFLPLLVLAGVIFVLYRYRERIANYRREDNVRIALAIVMIVCEMSYFWRLLNSDMSPNSYDHLPITICGWACIFGSFMLFTKKKFFFDVCYFWVLALSFNALITPVPLAKAGPTRFRYYQYWIEHISIYAAVFYMIFVHKFRPTLKSLIPAGSMLVALAIVAIWVNTGLSVNPNGDPANYLYIATTEDNFSIANFLPANLFLRYFIIILLVSTLFALAYLPWLLMDIKRKKQPPEPASV